MAVVANWGVNINKKEGAAGQAAHRAHSSSGRRRINWLINVRLK